MEVNTLPDKEMKLIKGNGMLTDLPFDKCQKISRPKRASGYPTWAKPMFNELKGKLVHILYNGNYHWVVISNINCSKNKIDY